jgi:ABC-2 type transport system ATP-binding protein
VEAVVVENLTHTYPAKKPSKVPFRALKGISFSVEQGEMFGLLGPNGGGKSTTFHILATYFRPSSGILRIFGKSLAENVDGIRRDLGIVFQSPGLDGKLTVQENLIHQGHLYGLSGDSLSQRVRELLDQVKLSDRAHDLVEALSGGLKRRVEIAKGLLHRPKLLLLDEPSMGLDPGARRDLWNYMKELMQRERITIIVTTHLMEEADLCHRVAILHEGQLVALGTPAALKQEIGGDVISMESADPQTLAADVEKKYGLKAQVMGDQVRLEKQKGHEFIPQLASDFPGQVKAITLSKPTLEDVFIKKTGHRLWVEKDPS